MQFKKTITINDAIKYAKHILSTNSDKIARQYNKIYLRNRIIDKAHRYYFETNTATNDLISTEDSAIYHGKPIGSFVTYTGKLYKIDPKISALIKCRIKNIVRGN